MEKKCKKKKVLTHIIFHGQTRLGNPEVRRVVEQSVQEHLTEYLELHPDALDAILFKSLNALKVICSVFSFIVLVVCAPKVSFLPVFSLSLFFKFKCFMLLRMTGTILRFIILLLLWSIVMCETLVLGTLGTDTVFHGEPKSFFSPDKVFYWEFFLQLVKSCSHADHFNEFTRCVKFFFEFIW